jgi:phosphoenolpyruvate carboxylase
VLEFGSWVGGDQDGNPFVEPGMINAALGLHREVILKRHLSSVLWLVDHLSVSARMVPVSDELRSSVERDEELMPEVAERHRTVDPNELYRRKLLLVAERLRRTLAEPRSSDAYTSAADFVRDLSVVRDSLLGHGGERIASGGLRDLIRQAEIFGFHLAKLDVRQESSVIVRTVARLVPRTRAKIWNA